MRLETGHYFLSEQRLGIMPAVPAGLTQRLKLVLTDCIWQPAAKKPVIFIYLFFNIFAYLQVKR